MSMAKQFKEKKFHKNIIKLKKEQIKIIFVHAKFTSISSFINL
jgi:hypothetical protein